MTNMEIIEKARRIINNHERPEVLPLEDIWVISAALGIARILEREGRAPPEASNEALILDDLRGLGDGVVTVTIDLVHCKDCIDHIPTICRAQCIRYKQYIEEHQAEKAAIAAYKRVDFAYREFVATKGARRAHR